MTTSIVINGARLDEVTMRLVPARPGVVYALSYPASDVLVQREAGALRITVPACLAVELYRVGILPQNPASPVNIEYCGRESQYVVSSVFYADENGGRIGRVTFTMTKLSRSRAALPSHSESTPRRQMSLISDLTYLLNESGELITEGSAMRRKLAALQTRLVEVTTARAVGGPGDTSVRCRKRACRGTVHTRLEPSTQEIEWRCPACGDHGVIRNWQQTKWDRRGD